jgi:hypothetical protein
MHVIEGANHYFVNQPEHLKRVTELVISWLEDRNLY